MYSQITDGETQIFVGHRSATSADLWAEGLKKIFKMKVLQMNKQVFGSINNYWQSELLKLNRLDFHVIDVNFSKVSWQFPKKDPSKLYT